MNNLAYCRWLAELHVEKGERRPRTFGAALCLLRRKGLLTKVMKHQLNHQWATGSKAAHGDPITYDRAGQMMKFVGELSQAMLETA